MDYSYMSQRLREFVMGIYKYYAANKNEQAKKIIIATSMIRSRFPLLCEYELKEWAAQLKQDKKVLFFNQNTIFFSSAFILGA